MGQSSDSTAKAGDPGMLKNTGADLADWNSPWPQPWTPAGSSSEPGTFTARDRLMLKQVYEMLKRLESVIFRDKEVSDLGDEIDTSGFITVDMT